MRDPKRILKNVTIVKLKTRTRLKNHWNESFGTKKKRNSKSWARAKKKNSPESFYGFEKPKP